MSLWRDIKVAFKQGMREQEETIANRRKKSIELMQITNQLESVSGSRDINPPLKMSARLMSYGIDPQDMQLLDTIGMAYSEGKFNLNPNGEDLIQKSLDKINETEGKK